MRFRNNVIDPYRNFTGDFHHDILHGGLMHNFRIVLYKLYVSGHLTLEDFNERVNNFDCGCDVNGNHRNSQKRGSYHVPLTDVFVGESLSALWIQNKEKTPKTLKEKYDKMFTVYRFMPILVYDLIPCGGRRVEFSARLF